MDVRSMKNHIQGALSSLTPVRPTRCGRLMRGVQAVEKPPKLKKQVNLEVSKALLVLRSLLGELLTKPFFLTKL